MFRADSIYPESIILAEYSINPMINISSKFLLEILEAILIHSNTKVMNTMKYIRFMSNMN